MREYINHIKLIMYNKGITRRQYFEAERALLRPDLSYHSMSYYLNNVTPF